MPKEAWAAGPAGIWLGVESTVSWIIVLFSALFTHWKYLHGGTGPVVGHGFDYGEPGAAVCAVDKGVTITPVLWVKEFPDAFSTYSHVRGDEDFALAACLTRKYHKALPARLALYMSLFNGCYAGQTWDFIFKGLDKGLET